MTLPDRKYLIHKAVEIDKVKTAARKRLTPEFLNRRYIAQPKYDGCNVIITWDVAEMPRAWSRTGERVRSLEPVLDDLARDQEWSRMVVDLNGLVILGEAWNGALNQSEVSGKFRQHAPAPELEVVVFDLLTKEEFVSGVSDTAYLDRLTIIPEGGPLRRVISFYEPADLGFPTWGEALDYLLSVQSGLDGLILRNPAAPWTAGPGTGGEILKLKRAFSVDLRVLAVEEGKGKHQGRMGNLIVSYQDKPLGLGTGFTDKQREDWFNDPALIVGKIVEVQAMDFSSNGLLREPRFKGVRFDKEDADL